MKVELRRRLTSCELAQVTSPQPVVCQVVRRDTPCHRGRDAAMLRAFGDADAINEAWERDLEGFKEFLRQRCRETLAPERGAA
jgi:hypothetical protein